MRCYRVISDDTDGIWFMSYSDNDNDFQCLLPFVKSEERFSKGLLPVGSLTEVDHVVNYCNINGLELKISAC